MSGSIWEDVAFDKAAAAEAIAALERAASQLDQVSKDRAAQAQDARVDWSGAARTEFDQALGSALRQAGDLVAALRRAVGAIRQATSDATAEQQRRVTARAAQPCGGVPAR
ncbi:MAG: hypothetical protein ACRDYX_05430 [Egibacteraceae bacterium]